MKLLVNKESGKIYGLVNPDGKYVTIQRFGDSKCYDLDVDSLMVKYRPLKSKEKDKFLAFYLDSSKLNKPLTLDMLDGNEETEDESDSIVTDVGTLYRSKGESSFDKIVLHNETKESLEQALCLYEKDSVLQEDWGLREIAPMQNKCVLNFYGPPGTGKTISAKEIANKLGKSLLHVSYPNVVSKWVGETSKQQKKCFDIARKNDAILFFDEADSLVSKRSTDLSFNAQYMNQEKNAFMQELDGHDGLVIFTTNHFKNYDEAILRRVSQHVEFKLPDAILRAELLKLHIPKVILRNNKISKKINLKEVAEYIEGFSGGDILNLCINTIKSVVVSGVKNNFEDVITAKDIYREADKIKDSKRYFFGKGSAKGISLV